MNKQVFGCLQSPVDLRDYRVHIAKASKVELPEVFKLTNSTIKDQGDVNSCVAHALSSVLENHEIKNFSTGWIYGYRPNDYYQGEGMYPREALKTLQKMGAVKQDDFPYNIEMQEAKKKVDENIDILSKQAEEFKIDAYAKLNSEFEIKKWIWDKYTPVPISIATEHLQLDGDNIIQIPKVYPNSGHMMLIIGWNKLGFIVQNSWGKEWGKEGTAILPYEYTIREAWAISFKNNIQEHTEELNTTIKKPWLNLLRMLITSILKLFK